MAPVWGIVARLSLLRPSRWTLSPASYFHVHFGRGHAQSLLTPPPDRIRHCHCPLAS